MSIDVIPDGALLEIFSFYLIKKIQVMEPWHALVHVCRRWRNSIATSPRYTGFLHTQKTGRGDVGHLVKPTHRNIGLWMQIIAMER
jgi:hypothetical protein